MSEKLDITPSRMRIFKMVALLFSALHLSACFFWRVKVQPPGLQTLVTQAPPSRAHNIARQLYLRSHETLQNSQADTVRI